MKITSLLSKSAMVVSLVMVSSLVASTANAACRPATVVKESPTDADLKDKKLVGKKCEDPDGTGAGIVVLCKCADGRFFTVVAKNPDPAGTKEREAYINRQCDSKANGIDIKDADKPKEDDKKKKTMADADTNDSEYDTCSDDSYTADSYDPIGLE